MPSQRDADELALDIAQDIQTGDVVVRPGTGYAITEIWIDGDLICSVHRADEHDLLQAMGL